jgi:F-type H+-transporting ATPase subunit delta
MASVVSSYARAFADVVIKLKLDANQVRGELSSITDLLEQSVDLQRVWDNPAIPHDQKLKVLDAVAQRAGLVTAVRNFMAVLIEHRRMRLLPQIVRQFETELNDRLGFIDAKITSARELSPQERQALEQQVARMTGRIVRAEYATDTKVIGGAVVKIGSTIYDGSVRGQLHRIRQQLAEA